MKQSTNLSLVSNLAFAPTLAVVFAVSPLFALTAPSLKGLPALQEAQEEQEVRPPVFVKAPIGIRAIVTNDEEESLGVVHDHMIDGKTGRVHFVVVGAAVRKQGRARLVPYDEFTWNAEGERLLLPMSVDELAELPEYDPENPPSITVLGQTEDVENGSNETDATQGGDGEESPQLSRECVASSGILGSHIMALDDEVFASVGELILEPNEGTIAFVLAQRATIKGDPYIVPYAAMTWQSPEAKTGPGYFSVQLEKEALKVAPKLERGDATLLKQQATLQRIYRFYNISRARSEVTGISQRALARTARLARQLGSPLV